jgi:hypothetical protein
MRPERSFEAFERQYKQRRRESKRNLRQQPGRRCRSRETHKEQKIAKNALLFVFHSGLYLVEVLLGHLGRLRRQGKFLVRPGSEIEQPAPLGAKGTKLVVFIWDLITAGRTFYYQHGFTFQV